MEECKCEKPDPCFGRHPSCTDIPGMSIEQRCRDCFICGKDINMEKFISLLKKYENS